MEVEVVEMVMEEGEMAVAEVMGAGAMVVGAEAEMEAGVMVRRGWNRASDCIISLQCG